MKRNITLAALAALTATAIGTAYAASHLEKDALAVTHAKIGMTQAVANAEQHVGGKASHVEYEQHKGQWVYGVEVVKDQKVMDVTVDPMSGKILASVEDKNDHDDGHDRA